METTAPLFTALIALSMAISTMIRGARARLHQEFAYLAGVISIVFLCLFFLIRSHDDAWRYGLMASALLVPAASLQVYVQILRHLHPPFRGAIPIHYLLALLQLAAVMALGIGSPVVVVSNGAIVFGGLMLQVVWIFRLASRLDRSVERQRIQDLLWTGLVATLSMGLEMAFLDWNFFQQGTSGKSVLFPPFGSLATAAYIYFLGQVILRHRLLDRHEIVARIVVFLVMALLLGGVYGVLVRLVGRPTGPFAEAVNILIASILVLILYEPVKLAMETRVGRLLARERWEYGQALLDMKRRLPGIIEVPRLVDALFDGSLYTGRVDLASIYLYDEARDGYRLLRWDGDPERALIPAFPQRPFIDGFLEGRPWYGEQELQLLATRLPPALRPAWMEAVMAAMQGLQAEVCLPLQIGNTVVGVWSLRTAPAAPAFSEEELKLLAEIADQAAVLIDNSRSFERMKERDRLATLGQMSAGLAHEIRNPLGAIKGAVQVLARRAQTPREDEFLGIIVEEVDRLDGVVGQFLDYARPMNMHVEPTDSDLLLRSVLSLAEAQGLPRGVKIEYRPGEGVPPVPMDVEKLKQVVLNVVRNGIDAMGRRGGTLRVSTRARLPGGDGRVESLRSAAPQWRAEVRLRRGGMGARACVELRIEDEGDGIRPDDAPKLFIPFFTTKAQGTGLGLAISERIMREHGGEIELESSPGEGTRFLLRLPLPDLEPELDEATASGAEAGTGEETREAPGGGAVEQPEQPEQEEDGDTLEDLPPPSPEEEAAVPDDGGPAAPLPHSHRD